VENNCTRSTGSRIAGTRAEEIAIRQLGKINSYKNTIPIKRRLEVWKEIEEPERHITTSKNVPASRRYENNRKYRC
jgi:hypothetical protein